MPSLFTLPSEVILLQLDVGLAHDASLRWRKADLAGLSILASHDLNSATESRLAQIRTTYISLRGSG